MTRIHQNTDQTVIRTNGTQVVSYISLVLNISNFASNEDKRVIPTKAVDQHLVEF